MEKEMIFTCNDCGQVWKGSNYETTDYKEGYNCPKCNSENISGEDINE